MTNLRNYLRIEKADSNVFEITYPNNRYLQVTANVFDNEIQVVGGEFDEIWNDIQVSEVEIEKVELLNEYSNPNELKFLPKDESQLKDAIAELVESGHRYLEFNRKTA